MNYSNFKQGDIVILPISFSNLSDSKLRPAVIISNKLFNTKYPDVIALKITSIGHCLPFDVLLKQGDLNNGELLKNSTINCAFIMTIEKTLITKIIGQINENKLKEIKQKIKDLFMI
jgi:mRNA interferase MazF